MMSRTLAILIALLVQGRADAQRHKTPSPPAQTAQPRMLFDSEFVNANEIAGTNWNTTSPFGSGLLSNASFGEQQIYVGTSGAYGAPSPFAFTASGLTITATPSSSLPAVPSNAIPKGGSIPKGQKYTYTSGCISTAGLHDFTPPFYAEVKLQMPKGKGFWLTAEFFGDPMTGFPEVDIAQFSSKNPTQSYPALLTKTGGEVAGSFVGNGSDLSAAFHTYGAEILTTGINWYLDRKLVMSSKQVVKGPLFATVNLACGDTWSKTGTSANFIGPPDGTSETVTVGYFQVWNVKPF
jgi:hypothetical protein